MIRDLSIAIGIIAAAQMALFTSPYGRQQWDKIQAAIASTNLCFDEARAGWRRIDSCMADPVFSLPGSD